MMTWSSPKGKWPTWKEKRAEIDRVQKCRRFDQAREAKRSFRVEIEEMKKKTKCNRCGRIGHWARECRQKRDPMSGPSSSSQSSSKNVSKENAASYVEVEEQQFSFIASVGCLRTSVQQLSDRQAQRAQNGSVPAEVLLVSSPGFAVLDSGCGKTIIGERTLQQFQQIWSQDGRFGPEFKTEMNVFKFGNGDRETSEQVVVMPIGLAGRYGNVQAAIVKGDAPLLLSRPALKRLGATLDFENDRIKLFSGSVELDLKSNAAGQYVLDVLDFPTKSRSPEITMVEAQPCANEEVFINGDNSQGSDGVNGDNELSSSPSPVPAPSQEGVSCPCRSMSHEPQQSDVQTCLSVGSISHSKKAGGITKKQLRKLKKQVNTAVTKPKVGEKYAVVEVFCPPRFVPQVEKMGLHGLSLDIKNGWNLDDPKTQAWVLEEMKTHPPELMILCPPCTDAGGWFHINSLRMPVHEVLKRRIRLKKQREFCKKLIQQQIECGGRFMFEHPSPACTWEDPQFVKWCKMFHAFNTHMCCFNLHVPATEKHPKQLMRKSTKLLCSHADMKILQRTCPGDANPDHQCHRVVSGSEPEIGQVSRHAGIYTAEFVAAVLSTVPRFGPATELLECVMDQCCLPGATVFEALAVQEQVDPQKIKQTLHRLHKNLGHPSYQDLVRVLKHGQASEEAIRMARELLCDFCTARQTPTAANPGKTSAVQEFNERVGLDVKYLPGWKTNQKIPALNCVDHASSFQLMLPFFETETAAVIRKLYLERWVQWAGPPKEIVIDPARTNLGKSMVEPTELEGTSVMVTAGGAHWQLGKTEVHGGWFARVLSKVLEERNPTCKEEWLECVVQSHVKNQMIQNHGFTPSQCVFGKNPSLPGDLLSEPIAVVPSTASLQDEAIARTYEVRNAARRAVLAALLALQDDRTLRKALLARPRQDKPFSAGEVVAYWRDQKWSQEGVNGMVTA